MAFFPEKNVFVPLPNHHGLLIPWRMHPRFDLLIPVHYVDELHDRDRWRIGAFLSPSAVGLTYAPDSLRRAGLRVLASVRDRESLLRWLSALLTQLEIHGHGSPFEKRLAGSMALPGPFAPALLAEIGHHSPLFTPACLRWLLAEVIAAPPWPFGLPGRGRLGAEVEEFLFPNVARGRPPTESELLRAIFVVHEGFDLGPASPTTIDVDWVLAMTAAHAFGTHVLSLGDERMVRARHMWLIDDAHPRIPVSEFRPSELRQTFTDRTGISVDAFLMLSSVVLSAVRSQVTNTVGLLRLLDRLVSERAKEDFGKYLATARGLIADTPVGLRSKIHQALEKAGRPYSGWGSVPTVPVREFLDHPLLALSDGSLVLWSPNAFADRAADLPRFVLSDLGSRAIRSHVGRLFESYVEDRLRNLDGSRHRILTEDDLAQVLTTKVPDYLIAHGRDLLIVEVSSMGMSYPLASGNSGAVQNKLNDYRRKYNQAKAAVDQHHRLAQELLGLNAASSVAALVVTQDAIPNNPALSQALEDKSFVCTADEFEYLLDLAEAGWSLPQLVSGWQQSGRAVPLGAYLAEHASIAGRDLGGHRWARAIAEQFDLEAA